MKKGLFWVDERTSQFRYVNDVDEQAWSQPLSVYIPLEKIRRGQPVSVATAEDLKEIAGDDTDLYNALKDSSDTYCVLTNPSKHTSSIGLSLEYTDGAVSLLDGSLSTADKIHVLGSGLYIEDKDYIRNAFDDSSDIEETEYWPEFFDDYESSIGRKVYVKGSSKGELTIDKEEAYRAYNNIIVIGFVANANVKNGQNKEQLGSIEVQIEGDDRGALDSTQFEAVLGEDITVGKNTAQLNGETNASATKVLAFGNDDDEKFKFSYIFTQSEATMPKGFIAIQRLDGATAFIHTNGKLTTNEILSSEKFNAEDRAFVQVSKYYASVTGLKNTDIALNGDVYTPAEKVSLANAATLAQKLSEAFKAVAADPDISLKDEKEHHPQKLIRDTSTAAAKYVFEADDVGGTYEIYISSNLKEHFSDLFIWSRGSNYNKGYAVLADIRVKNRQVIFGVYNSGMSGQIKKGTRINVLKSGMFTDKNEPFEPGATYYLGSHGDLYKVPQEAFDCVVQVGTAQTSKDLVVDCSDPRRHNSGDFPVGYMKPSVKGQPEFGFWLMDGVTAHKSADAPLLKECLKDWYSLTELKIQNYNFGDEENPDIQEGFIIPAVNYAKHTGEEGSSYVAAQIKYVQEGVYSEFRRTPFLRKAVDLTGDRGRAEIPDIDITSLMTYGPEEDRIQVPELESLDIKLFVDASNDENDRKWVQLDPGFHAYDNYKYYGFKWIVVQTKEPAKDSPYGVWVLRAAYTAKEEDDPNALGVCLQIDPFAAPTALSGYKAKVFVAKHDFYQRQFDVENLYKNFVRESVVDSAGVPWVNNAVSGKAVAEYISSKISTNKIVLSDSTDRKATVEAYLKSFDVYAPASQDSIASVWHGDFSLQSSINSNWHLNWDKGLLKYSSTGSEGIVTLKNRVKNDSFALVPYGLYNDHTSSLIDIPEGSTAGSGPHGISNQGWSGNLDASWLQGAHLGYPGTIFSQNAGDTISSEDVGTRVTSAETITIPYIQKYRNEYITRLGNVVRHHDGDKFLDRNTIKYNDSTSSLNDLVRLNVAASRYDKTYESYYGKKVTERIHLDGSGIEFLDEKDSYVRLKAAAFDIASSIKYKYILSRYEGINTPDAISAEYSDKIATTNNEPKLDEALQAIYEMPLATYKTNAEYESNDSYFKRYFGIIVEQVAATKDKFKEGAASGQTSLDDLKYVYTDEEAKSIAEYLNLMTDNKEAGFSVQNAVGILLKAAKETQERLLNLEVSTYGKDSPTLPGSDEKNEDFMTDQKSTVAGLNRLVKALCREVFQDSNPTSIDSKGAWSGSSSSYSRLDLIDKEVNGEAAVNENGKRISLKPASTYPEDASVTQAAVVGRSAVLGDDEDFASPSYINAVSYNAVASTGSFDGINDAINRISQKLNTLTKDVIGEDNIKSRPKMLDYLRQTIDALVKDIYIEDSDVNKLLESEAYKKTALSRIDKIVQDLYKFEISIGTYRSKDATPNGKKLAGSATPDVNDSTYTSFVSSVPSTIDEFTSNASLLDLLIDQVCGDEAQLLRNREIYSLNDDGKTAAGYKNTTTYKPAEFIKSNEKHFSGKTIVSRLAALEQAIQILTLKFENNLNFEELIPEQKSSQYNDISSVSDFMNNVAGLLGLTFSRDGFKAERNSDIRAESIKTASGDISQTDLDLYNIMYDAVARIKNVENSALLSTAALGEDYDSYKKTKADYESLDVSSASVSAYSNSYTVSSDIRAVLKLLYGADSTNADASGNKTAFAHFATGEERDDNFVSSPATNGVSALETLYEALYNLPEANGVNAVANAKSSTYFNPTNPRRLQASNVLGGGSRSKFAGFKTVPNRIDALENSVKALYKFIDLGLWTDRGFQEGSFSFDSNTAGLIKLNGADTSAYTVYKPLSTKDDSWRLTDYALQAYFNSIANNKLITDETASRASAYTSLQSSLNRDIAAEASSRENADTALQNQISAEKSARENADASLQSRIDAKQDKLTAGSNISIDSNNRISATDTTYGNATESTDGLMSAADKSKLDTVQTGANNYSLPDAGKGRLGGVTLFTDGVINQTPQISSMDDRTYAVQNSTSGGLVVNVPWSGLSMADGAKESCIVSYNGGKLTASIEQSPISSIASLANGGNKGVIGVNGTTYKLFTSAELGIPQKMSATYLGDTVTVTKPAGCTKALITLISAKGMSASALLSSTQGEFSTSALSTAVGFLSAGLKSIENVKECVKVEPVEYSGSDTAVYWPCILEKNS